MVSSKLYAIAYSNHYKICDYDTAIANYNEIIQVVGVCWTV